MRIELTAEGRAEIREVVEDGNALVSHPRIVAMVKALLPGIDVSEDDFGNPCIWPIDLLRALLAHAEVDMEERRVTNTDVVQATLSRLREYRKGVTREVCGHPQIVARPEGGYRCTFCGFEVDDVGNVVP